MLGIALEGGGARGSYHIGVAKAYLENGYEFDGFVGTSIGSVNAAVLAQGDFEKALQLWENLSMDRLFDVDEEILLEFNNFKLTKSLIVNLKNSLKKVIADGGIDTTKLRLILDGIVDEKKIRASGKDFGLVTVSTSERKPYELFLSAIPDGLLTSYIMASASFPGFQSEVIDGKEFIDGGLYNNCPVNMLQAKGYEEIIAVRTLAPGFFRPIKPKGEKITLITPKDDLGNLMIFSTEQTEANIRLGYYDGLRAIKNLAGRDYYISGVDEKKLESLLISLSDKFILKIGETLGFKEMPARNMLHESIIPKLATRLELPKNYRYKDFVLALLEDSAKDKKIERFKTYDFDELMSLVKNSAPNTEKLSDTDTDETNSSKRMARALIERIED